MRKFLTFIAVLLMAGTAYASWNLRQLDDGGAVWVNENGVTSPVGGGVITVELDDISTASTSLIMTHRPGLIKKAYLVLHAAIAGTSPVVTIHTQDSAGSNANYTLVTGGDSITRGGLTPVHGSIAATDSRTFSTSNAVSQGQVIAVVTSGASTGAARATITIVIE